MQKRCAIRILKNQSDLNAAKKNLLPGRYLIQPPLVGADARDFRLFAESKKTAILVLCREPKTKKKKYPIVSIGGSAALRAQISPPKNPEKPSVGWFNDGLRALEKQFLQQLKEEKDSEKALAAILNGLQTIPHSPTIHENGKEILNKLMKNQEQE